MNTEKRALLITFIVIGFLSLIGIVTFFILTPELVGMVFTFDGSVADEKLGLLNLAKLVLLIGSLFFFLLSTLSITFLLQNKFKAVFDPLERFIASVFNFLKGPGIKDNKKINRVLVIIIIFLGSLLRIIIGDQKAYYHLDESHTLQFINDSQGVTIGVEDSTYIELSGSEIEELVTINKFERFNFQKIQGKIEKDNHPPLHFWLLHIFQIIFAGGAFSPWPGIILNILFYIGLCMTMFKLSSKIIDDPVLRLVPLMVIAFAPLAISTTVFLRMYELLMFAAALFIYLIYRFVNYTATNIKIYISIILSVSLGLLTQYYFIILLFWVFITASLYLIKIKEIVKTLKLLFSIVAGAGIALVVNPSMIQNLFQSSRGVEAISGLFDLESFLDTSIHALVDFANGSFWVPFLILPVLFILLINVILTKKDTKGVVLISLPIILTFLTVAKVAPYITARYYVFLLPGVAIILASAINYLIKEKRVTYILLFMVILWVPRFVSNETFDKSMGSTFLGFNDPNSGEYRYLMAEGSNVLVYVDTNKRWKNTAAIPSLVNKNKVIIMSITATPNIIEEIKQLIMREEIEFILLEKTIKLPSSIVNDNIKIEPIGTIAYFKIYEVTI